MQIHPSVLRNGLYGLAMIAGIGVWQPLLAQSTDDSIAMSMEAVAAAYDAGDLVKARAGLLPLAEAGEAVAQYRLGFLMANGEGGPVDLNGAIKWIEASLAQDYNAGHTLLARAYLSNSPEIAHYERAAELLAHGVEGGEADAHYYLGELYRSGRGVKGDKAKAFELINRAAKAGFLPAQFAVAQMYSRGEGVEKDDDQTSRWLLQAAEDGYGEAQMSLYFNYSRGTGFAQDDAKALKWLTLAANSGVALAERILGAAYLTGEGVDKDEALAIDYLTRAARKGEPGAQSNLGYAYATGTGVEQDDVQAAEWYKRAADQGLIRAAVVMGDLYRSGVGVEVSLDEAIRYYQIGFSKRDETAASRLGQMIVSKAIPPEEEPELGIYWVSAAARGGDEDARNWLITRAETGEPFADLQLGAIYQDGLGVDVDPKAAAMHYRRGAKGGNAEAQAAIAELYATGNGVDQDMVEAHKWANVAAANGVEAAAERRDVLANLMTPDQVAEAQARAKEFMNSQ